MPEHMKVIIKHNIYRFMCRPEPYTRKCIPVIVLDWMPQHASVTLSTSRQVGSFIPFSHAQHDCSRSLVFWVVWVVQK